MVLWAKSTTKDYIRAENKLQSISKLFIPQVSFSQTTTQLIPIVSEDKLSKTITHVLVPIYHLQALNMGSPDPPTPPSLISMSFWSENKTYRQRLKRSLLIISDRGRGGTTNIREWTDLEFAKSQRAIENKEKIEETGCEIICGAPTILAVKG